ncbi:MAG TPA: transglycosylase domain-containing protein [Candidatus Saccharimonadales bacterium]|nr:transglycosylase domain-containing protein [Candidatus Saccharimonadales bacterium]
MNSQNRPTGRQTGRKRPGKNTFTTKSGNAIKLNRSLSERIKASRDARARRRAAYLSTLPKNRFKRILYRMHPKRVAQFWFSRDGAIMALKLLGAGIVVGFILVVGVFAYFRKDLPRINDLSGSNLGGSITYYDRSGTTILWQDYNAVKRQPVSTEKIAKTIRDATVAVEDKDYYKHGAFDVRGIARAGVNNLTNRGGGVQGGSTISQQLVKLDREWTADRTIGHKIKEVILAVELEREYSKEDILTGYLNAAPYGPVAVGVQVAAQDYFGVDAKDLTIAQASMLAAIPKAPSTYSPYGPNYDAKLLIARQQYIIDQMANQKMITKEEAKTAKTVDVLAQVKPQQPSLYTGIKAPYFVLAAKQELETKYGAKTVQRGGWRVITTLDLKLQDLAEKNVQAALPIIKRQRGDQAAFVAEDNKTGQIVAAVGGVDFNNPEYGEFNYATDANISPGSSFKPYDYVSFIENHTDAGAGSVLYDQKGPLPGYPCTNPALPKNGGNCLMDYDFNFPGPITLRYALGGSRNITAVKAMLSALPNDTTADRLPSINKTISTAKALMGNTDGYRCYQKGVDVSKATSDQEDQCFASSAIGDGSYLHLDDHVNGIASIARLGNSIPKTYILKITDGSNKVLDEFKQPKGKQVVRPEAAYIVTNMASDPKASYLPGSCTATDCTALRSFGYKFHRFKGWEFAIKTGTTNDAYDGLMASWSNQYTAVTWVGYHTRTVAMTGNMETMTEPIVRGWMEGAHADLKPNNWQVPSGIKTLPAFVVRGKISRNGEIVPSSGTDIFPSWYVAPKGSGNTSRTTDLVSGKQATSCTPDLAKKTDAGGNTSNFSADNFVGTAGGSGASTSESDDVHNCNDDKPNITLTAPDECDVGSTCTLIVTIAKGTHPLTGGTYTTAPAGTLSLIVNGQTAESVEVGDPDVWTYQFKYKADNAGTSTVQVRVIDSVLYDSSDQKTVTFNN